MTTTVTRAYQNHEPTTSVVIYSNSDELEATSSCSESNGYKSGLIQVNLEAARTIFGQLGEILKEIDANSDPNTGWMKGKIMFNFSKALGAIGYGILAGLGAVGVGLSLDVELPVVNGSAGHILLGLAIALIYYTKPSSHGLVVNQQPAQPDENSVWLARDIAGWEEDTTLRRKARKYLESKIPDPLDD